MFTPALYEHAGAPVVRQNSIQLIYAKKDRKTYPNIQKPRCKIAQDIKSFSKLIN